ncbi:LasR-specific antiactivator QslA [Pseudomonas sp. SCB32]|uniref:LasR-specific antiactivator QslA n=1 Tax=Pseudomonas sp. SCB32 TaxID=2653853 RepID=UPI001263F886|nr:LasR-specific antiactivator QslA [Pseudomonas sp. SCB32]
MGHELPELPRAFWTHVPSADGQPGFSLDWPEDCQGAMDEAVQRVERWFGEHHKSSLWIALFIGRDKQEGGCQRVAYETAFLWRLQQRLMATTAGAAPEA